MLFTRSYIEKYRELNVCGDNRFACIKHSYIYDAERKSMIIGGMAGRIYGDYTLSGIMSGDELQIIPFGV